MILKVCPGPARAGQDVLVSVAAQGAPSAGTQGCAYFVYKYCPYFPPRSDSLLLLQITKIFPWPHFFSLLRTHIWYFPSGLLFLQFTKIFPWHHLVSFICFVFSSPTSLPPAWLLHKNPLPDVKSLPPSYYARHSCTHSRRHTCVSIYKCNRHCRAQAQLANIIE